LNGYKKLEKDSSLLITTKSAQAGIRGTQFSLETDQSRDLLCVHQGVVFFMDAENSINQAYESQAIEAKENKEVILSELSASHRKRIIDCIEVCQRESDQYSVAKLLASADKVNKKQGNLTPKDSEYLQKQIDQMVLEERSIKNIKEISIDHTLVSDLDPVNQLTNLQTLNIEGDYRKTILLELPPLKNLTKLTSLKITAAFKLQKIQSIGDLKNLQNLFIGWSPVDNSDFLKSLSFLENLTINYWKTKDLHNLSNCRKLKVLKLSAASELKDLSALQSLRELEEISITQTKVEDLEPLKKLRKLKILNLKSSTTLKDVTPLFSMKWLESLILENTGIKEKDKKRLKTALPNCQISY